MHYFLLDYYGRKSAYWKPKKHCYGSNSESKRLLMKRGYYINSKAKLEEIDRCERYS